MEIDTMHNLDALEFLEQLEADSVDCCITSPPYYGLRDYGVSGQMGLETSPKEYIAGMVRVFRELRRALKPSGTFWLNVGDSYASSMSNNGGFSDKSTLSGYTSETVKGRVSNNAGQRRRLNHGLKHKDLMLIPHRLAIALQEDGWYVRQDIVWHKPTGMPESVKDRCTRAHEYIFLLTKEPRYFYDWEAISTPTKEAGRKITLGEKSLNRQSNSIRKPSGNSTKDAIENPQRANKRSVWTIHPNKFKGAHFATFPPALVETCMKAGCPEDGLVIDPFGGSGTVALSAIKLNRRYILNDLNPEYVEMATKRIQESDPYQHGERQLSLFANEDRR